MANQNSTQERLDSLSVGDEYAYAILERKASAMVKATVKEIGVHIPGYVTPIGVTVEYERFGSAMKGETQVSQRENANGDKVTTVRKDTHVKWLARTWEEERKEQLHRRLIRAKDEAYNAAQTKAQLEAMKPVREHISEWRKTYDQDVSIGYKRGARVRIVGGASDGTEFVVLGSVKETLGRYGYGQEQSSRTGIVHGFTRSGNPSIHWVTHGESIEAIKHEPEEKLVEKEYDRLVKEAEEALS